jgi:hypothetical protein
VLVYHVGAVRKDSPIGGDDQDWAGGTAIRVLGARVAANVVLPELRDGRGSLLFTGACFALHPNKEYASLSVGKAAPRANVQVLHVQLAGTGVHATIVTVTKGIGSEALRRGSASPGHTSNCTTSPRPNGSRSLLSSLSASAMSPAPPYTAGNPQAHCQQKSSARTPVRYRLTLSHLRWPAPGAQVSAVIRVI